MKKEWNEVLSPTVYALVVESVPRTFHPQNFENFMSKIDELNVEEKIEVLMFLVVKLRSEV